MWYLVFVLTVLDFSIICRNKHVVFCGHCGQYISVTTLFDFLFVSRDLIDIIQFIFLKWYRWGKVFNNETIAFKISRHWVVYMIPLLKFESLVNEVHFPGLRSLSSTVLWSDLLYEQLYLIFSLFIRIWLTWSNSYFWRNGILKKGFQ